MAIANTSPPKPVPRRSASKRQAAIDSAQALLRAQRPGKPAIQKAIRELLARGDCSFSDLRNSAPGRLYWPGENLKSPWDALLRVHPGLARQLLAEGAVLWDDCHVGHLAAGRGPRAAGRALVRACMGHGASARLREPASAAKALAEGLGSRTESLFAQGAIEELRSWMHSDRARLWPGLWNTAMAAAAIAAGADAAKAVQAERDAEASAMAAASKAMAPWVDAACCAIAHDAPDTLRPIAIAMAERAPEAWRSKTSRMAGWDAPIEREEGPARTLLARALHCGSWACAELLLDLGFPIQARPEGIEPASNPFDDLRSGSLRSPAPHVLFSKLARACQHAIVSRGADPVRAHELALEAASMPVARLKRAASKAGYEAQLLRLAADWPAPGQPSRDATPAPKGRARSI